MTRLALSGWALVAVAMVLLWARQLRTRNATSVDVAWAGGLAFLSLYFAWSQEVLGARAVVVSAIATVWALRLALFLYRHRVVGRPEDGRYAYLRAYWGHRAPLGFFFYYQAQAVFALIFSMPILGAMQGGALGLMAWSGVAVWLVAVAGESVADRQLTRFRSDPARRGQVCEEGLWRYSRHPNYFFEWLHWWAYVLIGGGALLTWVGPAAMLLFLFRLTGIPYTEAQALRSRGEAYRRYQATVSVFIPWFRKGA